MLFSYVETLYNSTIFLTILFFQIHQILVGAKSGTGRSPGRSQLLNLSFIRPQYAGEAKWSALDIGHIYPQRLNSFLMRSKISCNRECLIYKVVFSGSSVRTSRTSLGLICPRRMDLTRIPIVP